MGDMDIPVLEESVRDCLTHLYDYNFLQDHPLVRLLMPQMQGNTSRVQAFQQLVLAAIERLKPYEHGQGGLPTKSSRLYSILNLRYQHQYQVQYVLRQLNLGERQFYRDHAKAVQALAHVLEDLIRETPAGLSLPNVGNPANTVSIQAELERAQQQSTHLFVDAEKFLRKTLTAIKVLSERQQTAVTICCADPVLPNTLDQTLLRQVIIWIASQLLMQAPLGSRFEITFGTGEDGAQISFRLQPQPVSDTSSKARLQFEEHHETLETLLNALGGRLYQAVTDESIIEIVLEIPFQQHSILIIDDNPDAVALFRQFLTGHPYQIYAAHDGTQAIALAHKLRPEVIILDVLLPNQDGWEVLQQLKNHPTTMNIAIIICSVLDASDLAIMLGADAFMLKPPQEEIFFDTLKRVTQLSPSNRL
jgi:CheY-like chemotaxis protein